MTTADWQFVKSLALQKHVTLKDAGVTRRQRLGFAIDSVLTAAERQREQTA